MSRVYIKGKRLKIGPLTLTGKSHYTSQAWHREGNVIKWRHVFRDKEGQAFVYTGNCLGLFNGQEGIYLKCTIKKIETDWDCVRIMRPVIVHVEEGELI